MKLALILPALLFVAKFGYCQQDNKAINTDYFRLVEGSNLSKSYRAVLLSDIDTTWNKWNQKGYHFGFDPKFTPMYTSVNGILSTPYMIQVRGNAIEDNKKRGVTMFLKDTPMMTKPE